jgi:Glycosyl hydrolase catalytic core/Ricin-type beta-trefoil lectin domain-like/Concanavalin A-like lectin/glucanases superfamily/Bacterial Ig-like domain (group 2)
MKTLRTIVASAIASTALAIHSDAQIQVAGTLLVNIDPSALPLGPISWVTNSVSAGGVFEATGLAAASQPVVVAVGGGAKGIMFDGNNFMQNVAASGGAKRTLPAALSGTVARYSIECWVMNPTTIAGDAETMVYWGVRGTAGLHTAFSYSANASQGAMDHWGNNMYWVSLPAMAVWHHLAYTFDGTNQNTYVDGKLDSSTTVSGVLNANAVQPITLAAQRNADGTLTAVGGVRGSLTLGRVRIHSAALSGSQVAANYNLEKTTFVMAPTYPAARPTHRYTFNNVASTNAAGATVTDFGTPGGANGVVRGNVAASYFTGTKLALMGGSSASQGYVDLPNGLLSGLGVNNGGTGKVTLEGWATVSGNRTWQRLFDFGSTTVGEVTVAGGTFNGVNYFELGQNSGSRDWARCEVMNNGYNGGPNVATTRDFGLANDNSTGSGFGLRHYAVTWDEAPGEIIVYENGVQATRFITPIKFNGINDVNVWLGRSAWSADNNLQGTYDEFRIYSNVLSAAQVQYDYQAGPNTVTSDPGALQAVHLQLPHTNLLVGAADQIIATGDYPSVSGLILGDNAGCVFSSSDTNVVTVSSNGLLQAVGAGTATVTVTAAALSDTNTVTVVNDPGALLAVRLGAASSMLLYSSQQTTVRGDFVNVADVDLLSYGQPVLSSANSNVLVGTSSGLLIPVAPGSASITATFDGVSSSAQPVTVVFPTNQFIFDTFGDGFWTIINKANTNTLVVSSTGASQAVSTNTAFDQQFKVLYNLENRTFRLRNHTGWLCIGAQSGGTTVGTKVVTINYNGTSSQQWYLVDVGGGYFRIVNAASRLVLQTDGADPASVTLAAPSASPLQYWRFAYQTHYPKKGTGGYEDFYTMFKQDWAYNWGTGTGASLPASCVFEPMQWGGGTGGLMANYTAWHTTAKPLYLMGFNEPDHTDQANMTAASCVSGWPALVAMNLPLVSTATANSFGGLINDFFAGTANNGLRVDYTAVHMYQAPSASGLINNLQAVYNTWGKPVWLTEFSPVDWSATRAWSEQDNYNGLAEFMWRAEDLIWLKRYALFPFTGTPSTNPWDLDGHRGDTFTPGNVLTPYGELFAAWDADRTIRVRTPYIIHNLATSFRMASSNSVSGLRSASIRVRNPTTEWAFLPAPITNRWYIISLNDGRRLRDTSGTLDMSPLGTIGTQVEWTFTGPDSSGYYYVGNPAAAHNVNSAGAAPAINFTAVSSATQNNNTRWRLVKPYQPVSIVAATAPANLTASPSNNCVTLSWPAANRFYNVYRGSATGGPYTRIATALTSAAFVDNATTNGVPYFYTVTGLNILGEESGYSTEATATPSIATGWRQQWFSTSANTGNAADTADPDTDGVINVLERAFDLNPTVTDTSGWPTGALNGDNFTLTYRKSLAATDLNLQVVRSFDLINWSATSINDVPVSTNGTTETREASVPIASGNPQFLRLQVTAP